jgi:large subunit ribosomal protein L3
MKALITRKIGMTSATTADGEIEAVTLLSANTNTVTQIKSMDHNGYNALQVGTEKVNKLNKALSGHFKTAKIQPKVVREFRIDEISEDLSVGTEFFADVFDVGDIVDVTGVSKGKGWAGTIKRHNFQRGRKTHGGRSYRRVGSIGSMYPQKIFKGKRMAGHMGHDQITVKNLKIAIVDKENSVIGVVGAVPGPRKGVVIVKGVAK